jgi:GTP-sensing pleiotropic transcriptional regulator CodY
MAPEETMMTLCPSRRSLIAVSTIKDKIDRIGSCVVSSTIEDVPITMVSFLVNALLKYGMVSTNFNDYCQMPAGFHGCGEYYG